MMAPVILALTSVQFGAAKPRSIDVQHSRLSIYVYKQGLFAFAGDNHDVDAPIVSGQFDQAGRSLQLTVDATRMRALDPTLSPDRRAKVQANMMGPQVLDVSKYPTISFRSTSMSDSGSSHLTIDGDLSLHGQTHPIVVQATKVDGNHFRGSTIVRQSQFGITPIRIAGGLVTVKDDVKVEFAIALMP